MRRQGVRSNNKVWATKHRIRANIEGASNDCLCTKKNSQCRFLA